MSLPLSNIVRVSLNTQPVAAFRRNFGTICLFTPEAGNVFNNEKTLFLDCSQLSDVESAFGSYSETTRAATLFFAQEPRPASMVIARWVKTAREVAAVKAAIYGTSLQEDFTTFRAIANGQFALDINGEKVSITDLNLNSATDLADVAALISTKLSIHSAACRYDAVANRFIIEANVAGSATKIGFAYGSGAGYLGALMRLEDGMAQKIAGNEALTLPAESLPEAFAHLQEQNTAWYAATVAASLTDAQVEAAAGWIQASDKKIFGVTTANPDHIEYDNSNAYKRLYDESNDRVVVVFDKNDPYAVMSFLARAMSVNFSANNSTLTMKFKQLPGVSADDLTQTEANKCKKLGINYYTYFDDVAMVAEGTTIGKRFLDEIHILDWFCDAVQKEVFATIYRSPTKIPLTDAGTAVLIESVEKVCREGVKNGAFASGVWNGDPFGTLKRSDYLEKGFYVYADSVDNLSTSDREQRIAPPIQVAVKMAGAIHSVDNIINFDR